MAVVDGTVADVVFFEVALDCFADVFNEDKVELDGLDEDGRERVELAVAVVDRFKCNGPGTGLDDDSDDEESVGAEALADVVDCM